jgi:hypothetical protein
LQTVHKEKCPTRISVVGHVLHQVNVGSVQHAREVRWALESHVEHQRDTHPKLFCEARDGLTVCRAISPL